MEIPLRSNRLRHDIFAADAGRSPLCFQNHTRCDLVGEWNGIAVGKRIFIEAQRINELSRRQTKVQKVSVGYSLPILPRLILVGLIYSNGAVVTAISNPAMIEEHTTSMFRFTVCCRIAGFVCACEIDV